MTSGLDLAFDDAQQAIATEVGRFCRESCPDAVVKRAAGGFPEALWRELAALGVLALATPEGDGGALELVAALEALGDGVFPGPLPATFFATQLLGESDRRAVTRGDAVVSVGAPPLMPWAPAAQLFIELDGPRAWKAHPVGEIRPVDTLGGEPWGEVALEHDEPLGDLSGGRALHDLALAAYLAAAGGRLVRETAEHARTRRQFGRTIGEFQAVAHPLADCAIRLGAAQSLARFAAWHFDERDGRAPTAAAAARISASRAAVETAYVCHQLFGALSITLEGPVFHVSRRIRQLASQPPAEDAARAAVLVDFGL